jgi:hypothetical protein
MGFASIDELLEALEQNPEEFELRAPDADLETELRQNVQGDQAAAAFAGQASTAVRRGTANNTTDNTTIPLDTGCTDFPAGSNITSVEVTGVVVLLRYPSCQFTPPYLPLWPDQAGVPTVRPVPAEWQSTARSARAF